MIVPSEPIRDERDLFCTTQCVSGDRTKAVIVYESVYGNTEKIAKAIGAAISGEVKVVRAGDASVSDLNGTSLLVVGSPTYGGKPVPSVQAFLGKVAEKDVKGMKFAAFDTRFSGRFVKMFGFASNKIDEDLKSKGGVQAATPEGFIVKRKDGPLKDGEIERAGNWVRGFNK